MVRGWSHFLLLVASLPLAALSSVNLTEADVGNWTVGDCLLAQFAMGFELHANASNPNTTTSNVLVPPFATANQGQSNCGNLTQDLKLSWTDESKNHTGPLQRNLTITFKRLNHTLYGVSRLYGNFEMGHFEWFDATENKTINVTSLVQVDTGDISVLMFKVAYKRSFLCADLGKWSLTSSLQYSFNDQPPLGTQMPNATISTKKVQFDAFRNKESPHNFFRTPEDCDSGSNDIVPIVVGVALAATVLFVLCAYMYGRSRNRQRGYQSV